MKIIEFPDFLSCAYNGESLITQRFENIQQVKVVDRVELARVDLEKFIARLEFIRPLKNNIFIHEISHLEIYLILGQSNFRRY